MLGRELHDPLGLEGAPGSMPGLGLLDCETTLESEKQLKNVAGHAEPAGQTDGERLRNSHRVTSGPALLVAAATLDGATDGALSADGAILATYCHGLFDAPEALAALLQWAGADIADTHFDAAARREADIDRLADAVDQAFRWEKLAGLLP
jgi:adenosylcobyric acid synthase